MRPGQRQKSRNSLPDGKLPGVVHVRIQDYLGLCNPFLNEETPIGFQVVGPGKAADVDLAHQSHTPASTKSPDP